MAFDKTKEFGKEAEMLKVLGHPIRLKIVAGLCTQECNVKHIWECLGLPQATVSQHLALLKNKGIIAPAICTTARTPCAFCARKPINTGWIPTISE